MRKLKNIIILAGGESSRFWPLTHKNLFSFCGKPLIVHQIEKYSELAENLFVISHESTAQAIQKSVNSEKVSIFTQEGKGASAALLSLQKTIEGEALIVNGNDVFEDRLFEKLFGKIDHEDADGVFAALELDEYFPGGYLLHEAGRVLGVVEKPGPENRPSNFMKMVVDYFKDFEDFKKTLLSSQSAKDDVYEVAISNYIKQGKNIKYFVYEGKWATLKYPWHVLSMSRFFLDRIKTFRGKNTSVHPTAIIEGEVYIDENVKVYEYAKIMGPAFIGKDTIIGSFAFVNNSMIGTSSVIGGYSEVTRSYLGNNVWLHRNYVGDSVLQDSILWGAGAVTANFRFDKKTISSVVKGERVDTQMHKMGAIIGSNVKVGVNASIMPGVKIAPSSTIMPGDIIKKDVQ